MTQRIILFLIIQVLLFGGIRNIYLQLFSGKSVYFYRMEFLLYVLGIYI